MSDARDFNVANPGPIGYRVARLGVPRRAEIHPWNLIRLMPA